MGTWNTETTMQHERVPAWLVEFAQLWTSQSATAPRYHEEYQQIKHLASAANVPPFIIALRLFRDSYQVQPQTTWEQFQTRIDTQIATDNGQMQLHLNALPSEAVQLAAFLHSHVEHIAPQHILGGTFRVIVVATGSHNGYASINPQGLMNYQEQNMQNSPEPYMDHTRPGGPGLKPKGKSSVKSFSEAEAKTFTENYSFMQADPSSKKEVVSVKFLTSKQASILLHDASIGVPDSDLVCVVELKGLRVVASNPAVSQKKRVAQYRNSYLVLDAQSGNVLLENHANPIIHE